MATRKQRTVLTIDDLLRCAESEIERETNLCFDVCSDVGQIFDNVKHMRWFKLAVAAEISTCYTKWAHLSDEVQRLSNENATRKKVPSGTSART